jgi:hypothetical protein
MPLGSISSRTELQAAAILPIGPADDNKQACRHVASLAENRRSVGEPPRIPAITSR